MLIKQHCNLRKTNNFQMPRLNKHRSLIVYILLVLIVASASFACQLIAKNPEEKYKKNVRMIMDEVAKKGWFKFEDKKALEKYKREYETLSKEGRIKQDLEKTKGYLAAISTANERLQKLTPPNNYKKGHRSLLKHFQVLVAASKIAVEKLELEHDLINAKDISKSKEIEQQIKKLEEKEQQIILKESDQEVTEVNEFLSREIGWKFAK